jgi:hypothetical protein
VTDPATPSFFAGARFGPNATEANADVPTFVSAFPRTSGHADEAQAVTVQADRKIIALGFHTEPTVGGFAGIRICPEPDGTGCTASPGSAPGAGGGTAPAPLPPDLVSAGPAEMESAAPPAGPPAMTSAPSPDFSAPEPEFEISHVIGTFLCQRQLLASCARRT